VTEATGVARPWFGVEGIDELFREPSGSVGDLLAMLLRSVEGFTNGRPPDDDRTVLVARIVG
jgi:hypothetical protein